MSSGPLRSACAGCWVACRAGGWLSRASRLSAPPARPARANARATAPLITPPPGHRSLAAGQHPVSLPGACLVPGRWPAPASSQFTSGARRNRPPVGTLQARHGHGGTGGVPATPRPAPRRAAAPFCLTPVFAEAQEQFGGPALCVVHVVHHAGHAPRDPRYRRHCHAPLFAPAASAAVSPPSP